jgi:hypothetical protein
MGKINTPRIECERVATTDSIEITFEPFTGIGDEPHRLTLQCDPQLKEDAPDVYNARFAPAFLRLWNMPYSTVEPRANGGATFRTKVYGEAAAAFQDVRKIIGVE